MPVHDYRCSAGHIFEANLRWDIDRTKCQIPRCRKAAKRIWLPRACRAQRFDPVVVFRDKAGTYRFPGRANAPTPKGCERVELKTMQQVARFEGEMNASEKRRWEDHRKREIECFAPVRKQLRGELVEAMGGMSNYGRDFARLAIKASDRSDAAKNKFEAGFHVQAFHYDGLKER